MSAGRGFCEGEGVGKGFCSEYVRLVKTGGRVERAGLGVLVLEGLWSIEIVLGSIAEGEGMMPQGCFSFVRG